MTEPQPGDRVRFRFRGSPRIGTIVRVVTAGRADGTGPWRQRRRAQIRYQGTSGEWCETHRDLEDLTLLRPVAISFE